MDKSTPKLWQIPDVARESLGVMAQFKPLRNERWSKVNASLIVSSRGRVASAKTRGRPPKVAKENLYVYHLLSPCYVGIRRYGAIADTSPGSSKIVWRFIHQMVAKAFLLEPTAPCSVIFKDKNPKNMKLSNLKYGRRISKKPPPC